MSADRGEVAAEQSLLEGKWGGGFAWELLFPPGLDLDAADWWVQ